jgi:type IV pilus assembly protein PilW
VILIGMSTLFVSNSKAQAEIEKANRQVENGRFALSMLAADLRNAGYYGEFDPTVLAAPSAMPDPCTLTVTALKLALPLPVQGVDNASASSLGCLTDVRAGTDIVVVRHAHTCVAGASDCEPLSAGGPYFQASLCNNPSELDSGDVQDYFALDTDSTLMQRHRRDCSQTAGTGTLAAIRRFDTRIYFIANNDSDGDGIPTLKRADIVSGAAGLAVTIVPLVEGIDNLQIEYGIDSNTDGTADSYTAAPASVAAWRDVMTVKLNLLARSLDPTVGYTDTKTYNLAGTTVGPLNDHFKRHVFQAMVDLPNPRGRRMP